MVAMVDLHFAKECSASASGQYMCNRLCLTQTLPPAKAVFRSSLNTVILFHLFWLWSQGLSQRKLNHCKSQDEGGRPQRIIPWENPTHLSRDWKPNPHSAPRQDSNWGPWIEGKERNHYVNLDHHDSIALSQHVLYSHHSNRHIYESQAWYFTKAIVSLHIHYCLACPWNAPIEIYNFLTRCLLPRRKCLGALALSKMFHTGLIAL